MKRLIKIILVVLILLYGANVFAKSLFPLEYKETVEKYATENNLDKNLVYAVIKAESNFTKDATSHKNALGLMQITFDTGEWCADKIGIREFDKEMLLEPETNIRIGTWYIRYLTDILENEDYAVMAYNAGLSNVNKWLEDEKITDSDEYFDQIPYEETRRYILKVKLYKQIYNILY